MNKITSFSLIAVKPGTDRFNPDGGSVKIEVDEVAKLTNIDIESLAALYKEIGRLLDSKS